MDLIQQFSNLISNELNTSLLDMACIIYILKNIILFIKFLIKKGGLN